jgi:hypothetical protein
MPMVVKVEEIKRVEENEELRNYEEDSGSRQYL